VDSPRVQCYSGIAMRASEFFPILLLLAPLQPRTHAQQLELWLTTGDRTALLSQQPSTGFSPEKNAVLPVVVVADGIAWQQIEGFGASMTDSAAYLVRQRVPAEKQREVMEELFDPRKGIGVSFLRNPMGASDLARFHYSYNDLPPGQQDPNLERFTIDHDRQDILPLLRQALRIHPMIRMMGSPWSAPGWMKTSGSMIGGSLRKEAYPAFARYFRKYVEAYASEGVPVHYVSMQNEPLYVPNDYPGMSVTAAEQIEFLKNHLLPELNAARLPVRVLVYDHNWDRPDYPAAVLADPVLAGSPRIAGTAWHWYGGTAGAMTLVHQLDPRRGQYVTEASGGTWIDDQVKADFEAIIHSMRNYARAFVKWGLALNQDRGPHAGGCSTCTGLIEVNERTGEVKKTIDYYTLGHFSKFVRPGAVRVYSTNVPGVITAAFVNRDRSRVVVAYNETAAEKRFQVEWRGRRAELALPPRSGMTAVWRQGVEPPGPPAEPRAPRDKRPEFVLPAAGAPILASNYTDLRELRTEPCTDEDGGFNLGYAAAGSWAQFRNIDFGAGVNVVEARVASAGTGGMLEFRLDAPNGPLIAQAPLPVTGGWQAWTTVRAPVAGAAGIRDLYVVFTRQGGSGGLGNLNWFRFRNE
jgi:glucosylceramidase